MIKVLFVCLGNICRSPLAEALFLNHIKHKQYEHIVMADSCGTAAYHIGELADSRTRSLALQNGITMKHRARQFKKEDFDLFDYILVMDESNWSNLKIIDDLKVQKLIYLRNFDPLFPNQNEVPDPYYGDMETFKMVHEIINRSTLAFLEFIISSHGK
jgi:protein-tyrosine phosphatase